MEKKLLSIINLILEKNERNPLAELSRNLSLREDLGFDSLELAELTVRIEDEFGVDVFESRLVDKIHEIIEELEK